MAHTGNDGDAPARMAVDVRAVNEAADVLPQHVDAVEEVRLQMLMAQPPVPDVPVADVPVAAAAEQYDPATATMVTVRVDDWGEPPALPPAARVLRALGVPGNGNVNDNEQGGEDGAVQMPVRPNAMLPVPPRAPATCVFDWVTGMPGMAYASEFMMSPMAWRLIALTMAMYQMQVVGER